MRPGGSASLLHCGSYPAPSTLNRMKRTMTEKRSEAGRSRIGPGRCHDHRLYHESRLATTRRTRLIRTRAYGAAFVFALLTVLAAVGLVSSFTPPHWVAISSSSKSGGSGQSLIRNGAAVNDRGATSASKEAPPVPFLVERIDDTSTSQDAALYSEIAEMCIEAFFNDDYPKAAAPGAGRAASKPANSFLSRTLALPTHLMTASSSSSPTKSLQLAYLRNLQAGDLRRRREKEARSNMMFVARRLVPVWDNNSNNLYEKSPRREGGAEPLYLSSPLVLDLSNAYNVRHRWNGGDGTDTDYVRGEILGFVEVTNRRFGLGVMPPPTSFLMQNGGGGSTDAISNYLADQTRAVLTNLSVRRDVRKSGVGSRLLDLCEEHVASEWGGSEVVLEVEDDNDRAKDFYRKRGYQVVYADGTARRYDLSGLWLREVRCRRLIMRKCLVAESAAELAVQNTVNFGIKVLQAIKDNVFSSVS